jgi:hypothetical protein
LTIGGFIPYCGNWAGGGVLAGIVFEGLSVIDFSFLPDAADTFEAWPSTYFTAAQPETFQDIITIVRTPTRNYTALDYDQLWSDAGLPVAKTLSSRYNGLVKPNEFPNVTTFNFYGSNISTAVGVVLANLSIGAAVFEGRGACR